MNYINKHTGTAGAELEYLDSGNWVMTISEDNRFRKLINNKGDIKGIDINLMTFTIQVGEKLPGYNREITAIHEISDCKFMIECFPNVQPSASIWTPEDMNHADEHYDKGWDKIDRFGEDMENQPL
jgi:hypothetical protein